MSDLGVLLNDFVRDTAEWTMTGFTANTIFDPASLAEWCAIQTPEKIATFTVNSRESGNPYIILVLMTEDNNTFFGSIQPADLLPPKEGTESPWMQAMFRSVQVGGDTLIRVTPYIWQAIA